MSIGESHTLLLYTQKGDANPAVMPCIAARAPQQSLLPKLEDP